VGPVVERSRVHGRPVHTGGAQCVVGQIAIMMARPQGRAEFLTLCDRHHSQPPALASEYQLGMSDLLPPSPTALYTNLKPFTKSLKTLFRTFSRFLFSTHKFIIIAVREI
jgi:hypothetical protein